MNSQKIVRPINTKAIIRGIAQAGLAVVPTENEVPVDSSQGTNGWKGWKIYAGPTQEQVTAAGTPYFAVNRPIAAGYAVGGQLISMDAARGIQSSEPVWDFEVYAFHPYDPDNPNFDDATDDVNNLWQTFMLNPRLPFSSSVVSVAAPNAITVTAGDGKRFMVYDTMLLNGGVTPVVTDISGDTITFAGAVSTSVGAQASQFTCANSYPHTMRPDYAELRDGGPWCVGLVTVRVLENLVVDFTLNPQ